MTLGIYIASLVFGVVGWLIIREIKANDKRFEKLETRLDVALEAARLVREENGRLRNEIRILKMVLGHKGLLPDVIEYPSPPDHRLEDTA